MEVAGPVEVFTARYRYAGSDRLDITRVHRGQPDTWGMAFAPPLWLLGAVKGWPGTELPRGVDPPPSAEDTAARWDWYARWYLAAMRRVYRTERRAFDRLLALPTATLVCFCPDVDRCHRGILARDILPALGASYCGEVGQGGAPGPVTAEAP